jgi:hypothetical protein
MFAIGLVAVGVASGYRGHSASAAPGAPDGYAIRAVLASRQGRDLRYFQHYVGTARCAIPFVFRSVQGTCTTRVAPRPGYSGQIFVNFGERWSWRTFHYSGTPRGTLHHHWVFDLLPSEKVVLVRQTGDFPPNYAR